MSADHKSDGFNTMARGLDGFPVDLNSLVSEVSQLREDYIKTSTQTNERLVQISKTVESLHSMMVGDGNPEKSLLIRIDRLEQGTKKASRFVWMLLGASVALVAAIVERHVFK